MYFLNARMGPIEGAGDEVVLSRGSCAPNDLIRFPPRHCTSFPAQDWSPEKYVLD